MAQTVKLKRTSVGGRIPTTSNIEVGELAFNTNDKALFIRGDNDAIVTLHDEDTLHLAHSTNRVGIGTTSPSFKTHIEFTDATTALSGGGSGNWGGNGLRIENNSTTTNTMSLIHFRTHTADWHIGNRFVSTSPDKSDFFFKHENTEVLTILNDGKVGIGTTAPTQMLDVRNSGFVATFGDGTRFFRIYTDSDEVSLLADGSVPMRFYTGGAERLRIDTSGNVGIGTSSPDTFLDITGNGIGGLILNQDTGNTAASSRLFFKDGTRTNAILNVNGNLEFRTGATIGSSSGTKRLVVKGNGTVTFNEAYTFPASDGSANQVLQTDGSGNLSFATVEAGGGGTVSEAFKTIAVSGQDNVVAEVATDTLTFAAGSGITITTNATSDTVTFAATATTFEDSDGDTKIQVEESSDEDIIRFDTAGTQRMTIGSTGNVNLATGDLQIGGTTAINSSRQLNINDIFVGTTSGASGSLGEAGIVINVNSKPQILFDGGADSNLDIAVPAGEVLQIGHWNTSTNTATLQMSMETDGDISFEGNNLQGINTLTTSNNITISGGNRQLKFTGTTGPLGLEFGDSEANPNFRAYYRSTPNTLTFEDNGETAKHTFDLTGNYTAANDITATRDISPGRLLIMAGGNANAISFTGTGSDTNARHFAYEDSDHHYVTNRHTDGRLHLMSNNGTGGGELTRITLQAGSGTQDIDITNANLDLNSNNIKSVGTIGSGNITSTGTINASSNITCGFTSGSLGQQLEPGDASVATLRFDSNRWRVYAGADNGETLTVTETGLVGINTSSPDTVGYSFAEDLVINGGNSASDGVGITLAGNGKRYGVIAFGDAADNNAGEIWYDHNDNSFNFRTNGTQQITIGSTGNLNVRNGDIKIDNTTVIDSSRNLTNIGTVGCGAITSSGTISSGAITSSGTLKSTSATGLIIDTGAAYRDVKFELTGNTGSGTLEIIPMTVPGSGTSTFTTHIKNLAATGTTRHDLKVDGNVTVSGGLVASTIDVAGDLTLDADGGDVILKDGGTEFGRLSNVLGGLTLKSGSSSANAVIFSTTGDAIFAGDISTSGDVSATNVTASAAVQAASFSDGTISGVTFIDEDSFSTNSATRIPTQQSVKSYVDAQVAGVVDSAPAALNTLNELAAALGDDASFSTSTTTALGNRLRVDTASQGLTATQQGNAITNLGITATKAELNFVDGVTSNIQTQLNTKLSSFDITTQTDPKYIRSDANDTASGNLTFTGFCTFDNDDSPSVKISGDDFGEQLELHRNHSSNAPSIKFTNNGGQIGILYAADTQNELRWRDGSTTNNHVIFHEGNSVQFTSALNTKLAGIETGATADQTQSEINALGITATGLSGTPNITVGTINATEFAGHIEAGANLDVNVGSNYGTTTTPDRLWISSHHTGQSDVPGSYMDIINLSTSSQHGVQIASSYGATSGQIYMRTRSDNSNAPAGAGLQAWKRMYHQDYHPEADTLTTARTIAGTSFDGSANIDINYNNLTNKPTIPTNNNQLTNGAGYITSSNAAITNKLPLAGGTMTGNIAMGNFNITGVNQLEINDPGEGIVFKQGSSGDMVLKIIDDSSDNILQYAGTNAVFDVQGTITATTLTGTLSTASQPNITSVGTLTSLSSGAITSTGASSGRYTGLEVVNSTNAAGTETAIGLGVVSANTNACDVKLVANRVGANAGSDFYIEQTDAAGNQQETFRITESGAATFAGTIGSGAITSTGTSTFGTVTSASYKVGASTVIDNSRNLTNIGTISSGAITSTGTVNTFYSGGSTGNLRVGRSSAQAIEIYVDDNDNKIIAKQDSDSNGTHNFILQREFDGSGANNFIIRKGTSGSQFTIDTNGAITFNNAYTFPTSDGSANQVLQTDGSGNLSFAAASSGTITSASNMSNNRVLTASGSTTINGESNLTFDGSTLNVTGALTATTKSFDIEHPSKEGMRLRYGSLEGPENGVYVRGKSKEKVISLPDYWVDLVHEDSITVQLTAIGKGQDLYVEKIEDNKVYVNGENYFYYILAERKDVERFEVEYGNSI